MLRPRPLLFSVALALPACGDKDGDSGGSAGGAPTLEILSPIDGAFYDIGDAVSLSAEATDGSNGVVATTDVAWTAGSWSTVGNNLTVDDLPAGTLDLHASALVDGQELEASVTIHVFAAQDGG